MDALERAEGGSRSPVRNGQVQGHPEWGGTHPITRSEHGQSPYGQPFEYPHSVTELRDLNRTGPRQVFVGQMSCSLLENWPAYHSLWCKADCEKSRYSL